MVRITFVEHGGEEVVVDAAPGMSVMKAAASAGVAGIAADCGGNCACGTCRIYVDAAWLAKLPPARDTEREMVEYSGDTKAGVRLSCQIPVSEALEGLVAHLPKDQHQP